MSVEYKGFVCLICSVFFCIKGHVMAYKLVASFVPSSPELSGMNSSASHSSLMEEDKVPPISVNQEKFSPVVGEFIPTSKEIEIPPTTVQKVVAEIVGTFILIFMGCGSGFINYRQNITIVGVAFAWSLTIMLLVYTLGHISGAHLNPAVTLAFAASGKFPWKQVVGYVVAQLSGAILASVVLRGLFNGDPSKVMLTLPAPNTDDFTVFALEIMASFILMLAICGAASDPRAIKELSGATVGAAVFIDALIMGTVTGASMNPARSLGPAIATLNFHKIWIYIIAPIIGTTAASTMYHLLLFPKLQKKAFKEGETKSKSFNSTYNSGKEMDYLP